jgi:hypothetical protein
MVVIAATEEELEEEVAVVLAIDLARSASSLIGTRHAADRAATASAAAVADTETDDDE